ncbi:T9SS type B sorting domain-containing protein [Dyadobacter fanqingshengii]|uniref:Gliding motility-associated C-terminal domain-containing protein n=2 Tax=Dyadobacter fanqingshengii TaxID=2906443 RepID=A0A9X1T815_9BACT|nr:gliding motility-associated C-terminal domain-containing protein [Dyadobacter fanqingshengii]MCF0038449.1 gliding motility-associated C-terminal domain-containing protein [Dyadobacter fanqingshengii]USJ34715.1 gliding motility-associated C-terminal domain-containing protein [Dyadobacter fanqingshengii]
MRPSLRLLPIIALLFLLFSAFNAHATHFRAGEITARRISSLTYEIRLSAYFDVSPAGIQAAEAANDINFYFGSEGPRKVERVRATIRNIGNNTTFNEYVTIFTFPAAGSYEISVEMDNRNAKTLNLRDGIQTDGINFFVHTTLEINTAIGTNQTPVLLNAPIDLAAVGQRYIHNPNAFDADGDSLSFKLFTPQSGDGRGNGLNIPYKDPNMVTPPGSTEAGATPATFSINAITGDLIWDAPVTKGQYNVAFVVEEWRDGVRIGQIVRDMQILVEDARNARPTIDPLDPLCVEAGTRINQQIKAVDKDGNPLVLTSTGGVYQSSLIKPALATFTVPSQATGQVTGQFVWQTGCDHIRLEPYDVLFKIEDAPSPGTNPNLFRKLTDMTTLSIKVYGPKPLGLRAVAATDPAGTAYRLNWTAYKCPVPGARMVIYRREGCADIPEDVCLTGIPAGSGYEEIGRVAIDQTTYLDNNNGDGLRAGISYSYRIVVEFPRPGTNVNEPGSLIGGGESIASDEFCLNLPMLAPVITNVTVDSTSETRGVITVKWTKPAASSGLPAQYRLFRAVGQNGTAFTQIATINTNLTPGAADTIFIDRGLNTLVNPYNYKLEYYATQGGQLVKMDDIKTASSVRLEQGAAEPNRIRLNWSALVPWDNGNRTHRVYREDKTRPGTFNRIADVPVQGTQSFFYLDDGSDKYAADGTVNTTIVSDSTYCYKVETVGSYNNSQIKPSILYNFSQILCVSSSDTTKPCPPVLAIDQLNCDSLRAHPEAFCGPTGLTNHLSWTYPQSVDGKECDPNVSAYRIYYARYEGDTPALIATITTPPSPLATTFNHEGLTTFAGCYYVTAVNRFGAESAPSNIVCKDNCPMYVLPNVFTPNADGKNDVFQPYECPAFVQSLEFKAFNRWGAQVFKTNDVNINWNGKTNAGKDLAAGQYYYEVTIFFESSKRESTPTTMKGWVQIIR